MAPVWELGIPLPSYLSLIPLLGSFVCGVWVLFFNYWNCGQARTKSDSETSKQHKQKKIQKHIVPQLEENPRMDSMDASNMDFVSGVPVGWTHEYILWSIDRSLRQIFQHLENARSNLMEQPLPEFQDMISSSSSSSSSVFVAQEDVLPCFCEKAKYSTDHNISSGSSSISSSLSYLPVFSEGTTWQFQSKSLPVSPQNQPSAFRNQDTSLPPFQWKEPKNPELFQNLAALSSVHPQNSFINSILNPLNLCKQEERTKNKRKRKSHLVKDHRPNCASNKRPQLPEWAPIQLSSLVRGELEGHVSWKACTLRKQSVPLTVKESWTMTDCLVPESGNSQVQLSMPICQSTKQNANNKSPDFPSFQLHVNTEVETGLNRAETKNIQSLIKQLQSGHDPQILGCKPLVMSVDTPPLRSLEETTLLKKDPQHVLEISVGKRVVGLPEKRIQQHKAQVINVELTPRLPHQDSIKVTPLELLQVMDSMGMIPETHSEVIESASLFPNQVVKLMETMETVSVTPKPPNQVIESVKLTPSLQHQVLESQITSSRLNQGTDNVRVTPVALIQVMNSMGMMNKPHQRNAQPVGMTLRSQYEIMDSAKMGTLLDCQATKPGKMSPKPQHTVMKTVGMTPGPQHKFMESVSMTPAPQNQTIEQEKITPKPTHQNKESLEMISATQIMDHVKITPVALLQAMDFMGIIPPEQLHVVESGALTSGLQFQTANLTPKQSLSENLITSSSTPLGIVKSMSLPPKASSKVKESAGMIPTQHQSTCSLKVTPVAPELPIEMTMAPQPPVVESDGLTPQPISPRKKSPELTSGLHAQMQGSTCQGSESDSLTSGLSQQVMDSSKPTSWHQTLEYSEISPRQSHKGIETTALTSDTCLQMKKSELEQSHPQIMQYLGTTPRSPSQSTESIEMSQKLSHQVKNSLVMVGPNQAPCMQEVMSSLELQKVQPENRILGEGLQSMKSVDMTRDVGPQMVGYGQAIPTMKSINLAPECKWQSVKSADLVPASLSQSRTSIGVSPNSQFQSTECIHLAQPLEFQETKTGYQGTKTKLSSDICHDVGKSVGSTQSSLGIAPEPLNQTSESIELSSVSFHDSPKTRTHVAGEMRETPELQHKMESLSLLLGSEEQTEVLTSDLKTRCGKFIHLNVEPHSEVTNLSRMRKSSEYEQAETVRLTSPQVDKIQETIPEPYSKKGSLDLIPGPGIQDEKTDSSPFVIGSTKLSAEPKLHIRGLTPRPQFQGAKDRQMDPESQLQDVQCVNLIPQPTTAGTESEKPKPDLVLQNMSLEESSEGTQLQNVKSTDLNLGSEQPNVKSFGSMPGPQLQSVRFSKLSQEPLLQRKNLAHLISGPPHFGVKSVELTPGSPEQDIKLPDFISRQKHQNVKSVHLTPESQAQGMKTVEVNTGPHLQNVRFYDLIPDPKHQGFQHLQLVEGIPLQDIKSLGCVPESFLHLSQGLQAEDMKSVLSTEGSQFHSMESMMCSELQSEDTKSEEGNLGLWQQDVNFSEVTLGPKLQGVKFGGQIPGSMFYGMNFAEETPELGLHDSKLLAKTSPGLQDMKQVGLTTGPCLQDVKFFDLTSGIQLQGVRSSELNSRPHLKCKKQLELSSQSERQDVKPGLLVPEPLFQDVKYATVNHVPSSEGDISYELVSEPQILSAESMALTPGRQSLSVNCSTPTTRPQSQGKKSELVQGPQLEDIKSKEQTPISDLQGLKYKLIPEPQQEDHLGALKSIPEQRKVKSMLTPGPQAEDMDPKEPALSSKLQGLKSEFLSSGSQLEDMKSNILIPQPCLQGMKSTDTTPIPLLENVNSIERKDFKSMGFTHDLKLEDMNSAKLISGSRIQDLKTVSLIPDPQVQSEKARKLQLGPKRQDKNCTAFVPEPLLEGSQLPSMPSKKLTSQPQTQDIKLEGTSPCFKQQTLKSAEKIPGQKLQSFIIVKFNPRIKKQVLKSANIIRRYGFHGIKSVDLTPKQQFQEMVSVDLAPGPGKDGQISVNPPEWKFVNVDQLKKGSGSLKVITEPKSKAIKSVDLNSKIQRKDTQSFTLDPKPVNQDIRAEEFKCEPQWQSMNPFKVTPGPQLHQVKPQGWTLKPPLQGIKTVELSKNPQLGSMTSLQWIPGPEFQGVKYVGLNLGSQSQGVKPSELKLPIYLEDAKSHVLTPGSKPQGEKSVFSLGPQFQCKETPKLSVGLELQRRKVSASASEPQLRGMKTVELNKTPWLGSMRSVQWMPGPEFQVTKSMLNLGSQFQELKPSIKLRNLKVAELIPRPKTQGIQPSAPLQKHQPQAFTSIDLKSVVELRRSGDSISRSKLSDFKPVSLKPGFHLQHMKSELTSELQLQEVKPLESPLGTQFQDGESSVFIEGTQLPGVKFEMLSQGPQLQSDKIIAPNSLLHLKNKKSSELASQKKLKGMKSEELNSGSPWQNMEYSQLTPKTDYQHMKFTLSPRSQMKGGPFSDLTMGTKIQDIKSRGFKPWPQLQDVKYSESTLKSQLQEVKLEELESGPRLQDVESSTMIPGIQIQGVKPMDFSSESLGVISEVIQWKKFQDVKSVDVKSNPKLQDEKPDLTLGEEFSGVKSERLNSDLQLQDWSPNELLMSIKLQGAKSMKFNSAQGFKSVKTSEMAIGTKFQGVKSVDFNSATQIQGEKSSELSQETKLLNGKSVEFKHCLKLQDLTSDLIPDQEAVKYNSGNQLQGTKESKLILGTKLQDVNSVKFRSEPCLERVKSSDMLPGTKLQKDQSMGFMPQPLWRDVKSLQLTLSKVRARRSFKFNSAPQLQNRELFMVTPEIQPQDMKSMEFNPEEKLQGVKSKSLSLQMVNNTEGNHDSKLQVAKLSHSMVPSQFNAGNQLQDEKSHKSSQWPQFQGVNFMVLNPESHLQHVKSSELCTGTKFQDVKSLKVNSEQLQEVKISLGTQFPGMKSLEPQLEGIKPFDLCIKTMIPDVQPLEFKHEPELQGGKSSELNSGPWVKHKTFNIGPQLQGINSSVLKSGAELEDMKSKMLYFGPHLQNVTSSTCISGPKPPYINLPGYNPHFQGVDSPTCFTGIRPQCVNSIGCNPGLPLQSASSFACTSGPNPQCVKSTGYNPKPQFQYVDYSACFPEPKPQYIGSIGCNPDALKLSISIPGPQFQCTNSTGCNFEPLLQGVNSAYIPEPKHQCANYTGSHLQDAYSSVCITGSQLQCVNSIQCNPGLHLQDVKPSESTETSKLQCIKSGLSLGTKIKSETGNTVNFGSHLPSVKSELTPGSKFLGVAPMEYNPGTQAQCMNSSKLNPGTKSQCRHSTECKLGLYLKGTKASESTSGKKFQGIRFSELYTGLEVQDTEFNVFNSMQQLQDIQCKLTPKTECQGITSMKAGRMKVNSDPQLQGMTPSELNSESKNQCINSEKCSSGPQVLNTKPSNLNYGSESQSTKYVLFNSGSYVEAAKSELTHGTKCQGVQFLENQLGSQKQVKKSVVSLGPQSNDMKSVVFLPEPPETHPQGIHPEKGSSHLTQHNGVFVTESYFQDMKTLELKQGPPQSMSSLKSCFQDVKQEELKLGSQQQGMICQEFTSGWQNEKPVILGPKSSRMFLPGPTLTSVKFSNMSPESQPQGVKPFEFTSEPKLQGEKHVKLSSVSLQPTVKSVTLPPRLLPQKMKSGTRTPKTSDQITESSDTPRSWHQTPQCVNMISIPIYQTSEMPQTLAHKVSETPKKTVGLNPMPTCKGIESSGMPLKPGVQVPEFIVMTSRLGHQVPKSLLSCEKPMKLTSKSQYHMGTSRVALGLGQQALESVNVTSKLQKEESLRFSPKQTNQDVGHGKFVELNSETWQQKYVSVRLKQPQNQNMKNSQTAPAGPLDQVVKCRRINSKPLVQVTARSPLQVACPVEVTPLAPSVKVIPGPPLQVVKSVTLPKPTPQKAEYVKFTPNLQDVTSPEFASGLWLQNVKSQEFIIEPTHQILETMALTGCQVIKTVLIPGPLHQIVKSEELAPKPIPQVVETIGAAIGSGIEVACLNGLPSPHLQELGKPTDSTPKPNIRVKSAELISQKTSNEEYTGLFQKQRLQATKRTGTKPKPSNVIELEDLNQGQVSQNKNSEELTSEELQEGNYFSRILHSPSIPLISNSVKMSDLGSLQDLEVLEVSKVLDMKNFGIDIMTKSSALSLALHNQPFDKTANIAETPHLEIRKDDVTLKERTKRKHMNKLEHSLYSQFQYPPQSRRSPTGIFQVGSGTRRGSLHSFLGRQQNVWESHACRQRLPRKYLSSMLMLGNVLGTTMERKLCSQTYLEERETTDICTSIQNLFGVPAELMEFSRRLLEKGPGNTSQPSVVKNYIQRHTLCHNPEKRMPLRMWTRGSTSSIIRHYSGIRLGRKQTKSKLSDISQEVTQHIPVSCAGSHLPVFVKSESSFGIFYNGEDPVPMGERKNSHSISQTRIFESQPSLKTSYFSHTKTDFSEQFNLLQDLQLKIAAKLLRSQIPPHVPPPLASGLVLKYPICLQCGRCSGFNCCHKFQAALRPYLLIYPQLHLVSTPEGRGEIRLHLGFRLQTGKRPQVSKYRGRDRSVIPRKVKSPSSRKDKIYAPASKSPTPTRDLQSGSSQSPTPVQVYSRYRPKVWEQRDFPQVHTLPRSDPERNRVKKWNRGRTTKTSDSKYTLKRHTKLYTNVRTRKSPSREMPAHLRRETGAAQTSTPSLKRQPTSSSQPKFMRLIVQGVRQAFQTAHRIIALVGQKSEGRTRPDNLHSGKKYHPKQRSRDSYLARNRRRTRKPVKQRPTTPTTKQEDIMSSGVTDAEATPAQQLERTNSCQKPNSPQHLEPTVLQTDTTFQTTSNMQLLGTVQNDSSRRAKRDLYKHKTSSQESKSFPRAAARFQAQGTLVTGSLSRRALKGYFVEKDTPDTTPRSASERIRVGPSVRTLRHRSRRGHNSSRRNHLSPSERTLRSLSERRQRSPSDRRRHRPSQRSQPSSSERRQRSPSERRRWRHSERGQGRPSEESHSSPPVRRHHSVSERSPLGPSPSDKSHGSLSDRGGHSSCASEPRPSTRKHRRSHSGRTSQSPSKRSHHSHSERSPQGPPERKQHRPAERTHSSPPKERLKPSPPKERPRRRSNPNMSPRDTLKYHKAWQIWRPGARR
ncbi:spermatogenesis-associated protein 31H1 [Thomomys bottae]